MRGLALAIAGILFAAHAASAVETFMAEEDQYKARAVAVTAMRNMTDLQIDDYIKRMKPKYVGHQVKKAGWVMGVSAEDFEKPGYHALTIKWAGGQVSPTIRSTTVYAPHAMALHIQRGDRVEAIGVVQDVRAPNHCEFVYDFKRLSRWIPRAKVVLADLNAHERQYIALAKQCSRYSNTPIVDLASYTSEYREDDLAFMRRCAD